MNYVGLFEGISGFGLAFKRAGASILAVCEIDKTCQSVLRRHHPEAEIISDVKTISKDTFQGAAIDILAGGFPCQDLSVAGLRKGLDGERSGLWFEFLRIIADHKPRWVVIENVPGLLSSNGGRDFAIVLRGLAECGYFSAYRILDSQYDGVAQRRNRVFIVASLGTASCVEILFERESSAWDSPPSREAGEDITGTLTKSASAGGGFGTDFECNGGLIPDVTGTLKACASSGGWSNSADHAAAGFMIPVAPTLRSNGDAHSGFIADDGLVVASREVAQSLTSNYGKQPDNSDTALGPNLVMAMQINASDEVRTSDIAYTLNTNGNATGRNSPTIAGQFGVRRLTPTECERLQGFPDSHTAFGHDGKPISDSARYRMLGNAVCVPTAEWIAKRIFAIERGER